MTKGSRARPPGPLETMPAALQHCRLRAFVLAGVASLAIAIAPPAARAGTVAAGAYDLAIERPIGLAETTLGVAMAGLAWPIALGTGRADVVLERCIAMPARDTFTRGLGDFEGRAPSSCSPVGLGWSVVLLSFAIVERPLGFLFGRSPFADEPPGPPDALEV